MKSVESQWGLDAEWPNEPPEPVLVDVYRKGVAVYEERFHGAGGIQGRETSTTIVSTTRNWPTYWGLSRAPLAPAYPLPGGRFSLDRWPTLWWDGNDNETRQRFESEQKKYLKALSEGDIWIEGPFAGLPAH